MAKQYKAHFKNVDNTGFGPNSNVEGGRLTNKDGTYNLRKSGMRFYERISIYHTLLRMSRSKFFLFIFLAYSSINVFFACIYLAVGVDKLQGSEQAHTLIDKYLLAFFFSSQTLTTVGYGHISPVGFWTNAIASVESLMGIMIFALVTGMFYARFSRPRAYLRFSENLLVAPYKGGRALMFRIATYKNNHLTDAEAQVTIAIHERSGENNVTTRFFQLPLEFSRINSLALSWTIVHPLDEHSPIAHFGEREFKELKIELMVTIKAFDDHFSNTVMQRTSYTADELVYGAKFLPMFERSADGYQTNLQLNKVNDHEIVTLANAYVNGEGELAVNGE